jgi:hypothetical protein
MKTVTTHMKDELSIQRYPIPSFSETRLKKTAMMLFSSPPPSFDQECVDTPAQITHVQLKWKRCERGVRGKEVEIEVGKLPFFRDEPTRISFN